MKDHMISVFGRRLLGGALSGYPYRTLAASHRHARAFPHSRLFSTSLGYAPIAVARIDKAEEAHPRGLYLEVCPSEVAAGTKSLVIPVRPGEAVGDLCEKVKESIGSTRVDILTNPPESLIVSQQESALKVLDADGGFQLRVAPPEKTRQEPQLIRVLPTDSSSPPDSADVERLTALEDQRRRLLALQEEIRSLALRKTNKYAIGGVVLFSVEWALVYYGTYFLYGWDVMEPITYLLALLDVIVTYGFFMLWREDYSPKTLQQVIYSRHERKLSESRGFDSELQQAVEREIRLLEERLKK